MNTAPLAVLWTAKAVASLGRTMTVVALPWFVLQITGSGTQTGLAVASSGLAIAVVSFVTGAVIDRSGARRTCVVGLLGSGVAIGLVPLLHRWDLLGLAPLLVLVFAASALDSVAGAAVETLVPAAARKARVSLESANAVLAGIDRFALLIMPVVSGLAIALIGARTVLWLDTAACLVAAALLAVTVRTPAPAEEQTPDEERASVTKEPEEEPTPAPAAGARGYLVALADGVAVLRRDRALLTLALLGTALNALLSSVYSVVLLVYAAEVLGGAAHFAGMVAAVGGGALAGAVLYGAVGRRLSRRVWLLTSSFGAAVTVLALAPTPDQVPALALLAASGVVSAPLAPLVSVVFQERTPAELLGRVLSARNALMLAGLPVGMLLAGVSLDLVGLANTLLLIGGLTLVSALTATALPALRRLDPPAPAIPDRETTTAADTDPADVDTPALAEVRP